MSSHTIELTTRDGVKLGFDCTDEQNLLEAAASAHIALPSQCRQGSCGACYAEVTHGEYVLGDHSAAALPASDAQKGGTLLCCTFARSDLGISLPFNHNRILSSDIPRRTADIVAIEPVAENTVRLELRYAPDESGGASAEFEPGQFVELEVPGQDLKRAYSLANTSNWDGRLEFFIRLQPSGRFSGWLKDQASPGDPVIVHGPQGAFGLSENGLRPRWFVAGGTGLAPMLSMLRRMAEFQEPQPTRLYFGVNRTEELFYEKELDALQQELPHFQATVCVWKPNDDWKGFRGTPVDALVRDLKQASVLPDIYLCGPPALIDAAEAAALSLNVPADHLISERFLPA
jgi:ferredoxin-NADP reductase/ferredoxin